MPLTFSCWLIVSVSNRSECRGDVWSVDLFSGQDFAGLDVLDAAGADAETFLVEAGIHPAAQFAGAVVSELVGRQQPPWYWGRPLV